MKKILSLFVGMLLFCGCMSFTPPVQPVGEPVVSKTYHVSFDTAWRDIIQGLVAQGEVIASQDKETGIIRLQPVIQRNPSRAQEKEMGDCGRLSKKWTFIKYDRQIILKKTGENQVTIQIKFNYLGYAIDSFLNQRWQPCYSSGILEKRFLQQIGRMLPSADNF